MACRRATVGWSWSIGRGFWKRWYRPDLMAVVAVGDFDPAAVAQVIRDHFGALERPSRQSRSIQTIPRLILR